MVKSARIKRHETYIQVGKDKFYIAISEKINHVPHVVTAEEKEKLKLKKVEEKKYSRAQRSNRLIYGFNDNINYGLLNFLPTKTDYIPSEKLSLKIVNLESSYKRYVWMDTNKKDIFSQLNDFFVGLQYGAEYFKQKIINEKLRKIEEEEYYRQRRIEEDKRWEEEKKITKLKTKAEQYYEYTKLNNYLEAAKSQDSKDEDFIDWAEGYLDKVNPF